MKRPTTVNSRGRIEKKKTMMRVLPSPARILLLFRSSAMFTFQPIFTLITVNYARVEVTNFQAKTLPCKEFTAVPQYVVEIRVCEEIKIWPNHHSLREEACLVSHKFSSLGGATKMAPERTQIS